MSALLTSILVAIALAAGTGLLLYNMQKPVYYTGAKPTVRISDPGDNLVGPDWSGLYKIPQARTQLSRANADEE
jgi:hypothetical protein